MRVLAAPDKFRGTASAAEVCSAIERGVLYTGGTCLSVPMSDGGEGLLEVFGGANRYLDVAGPLGEAVKAGWHITDEGLAVIESAQACGLHLVGDADGNQPVDATTRGVGELILWALEERATSILIGLGGSATSDGGQGAVEALDGLDLRDIGVPVEVCCDVTTRFSQAARVYGPQKGATPDDIEVLTLRLNSLRAAYKLRYGIDVESLQGSGAAGGLAGGLAALGANLVSGLDRIADLVGLDGAIADCELVVTGEGRLDGSSLRGKVVGGVWRRAAALHRPVLAIVGRSDLHSRTDGMVVISLTDVFGKKRAIADTTAAVEELISGWLQADWGPGRR